jgi:hypothetical protein
VSTTRRRSNPSGLIAIAAVAVLAVIAFLLVVYAFRSPQIEGSGEAPGPAPTWSPQRSSTPTATSTPDGNGGEPAQADSNRLLAISEVGTAIRASAGACGVTTPEVGFSADGGTEWAPVLFGDTEVGEVVHLSFVSDTQIDAIVRTLPDCSITVLTSFTSGEFWAPAPDRAAALTYVDASTSTLNIFGTTTEAPCAQPADVSSLAPRAVLRCTDGLFVYDPASSQWQVLALVPAVAISAASGTGPILTAIYETPDCDGLGIRRFDLKSVPEDGTDITCVPGFESNQPVGLAVSADTATLWIGNEVLTSDDQGVSWNAPQQ